MTAEELAQHQELISEAQRIRDAIAANDERRDNLQLARSESIKSLHSAGMSWAAIARTFGVSAQAVMYASGLVKRTEKK